MNAKNRAIVTIICTAAVIALVTILTRSHSDNFGKMGPMASTTTMKLQSRAFSEGQTIPVKYTCDGAQMIPPLTISGVPENAKSLALIVEDPDTSRGTFTHWVVFNIPPDTSAIEESTPKLSPTFGIAGKNGAGTNEYLGPCPPSGTHRYMFKLYALDATLNLAAGASKEDVLSAMKGHEITKTVLLGMYGRSK
ncbi:MAG: hypothetical protein QOG91_1 [Candidatus Parcubacteria bacterium]|jgi:Raf kinase inhibitor-like YbhB/YbcL family protein|nr:hypothetical protein [Candidatus Parcubacteria bacterium]